MTAKTDTQVTRVAIVAVPVGMLSCVLSMQDSLLIANYCAYRFGGDSRTFHTQIVSAEPQSIASYSGATLGMVAPLPAPSDVDLILIPAGPPPVIDQAALEAWLTRNAPLSDWLRAAHECGAQIGACCTGTLILASAGLLDGLAATTHWAIEHVALERFPQVRWCADESIIEHDRIATTGGGTLYFTMLLQLIKQHLGADVANEASRMMLMSNVRNERQAVYRQGSLDVAYKNPRMETLKQFLATNFRRALSLEDMASAVSTTERTLMRTCQQELGMTPMQFLQRIRIEAVMDELQMTPAPVNQIIWDIGYEDVSSFQRLFKRHTGLTMSEYRRRFGVRVYSNAHASVTTFEA